MKWNLYCPNLTDASWEILATGYPKSLHFPTIQLQTVLSLVLASFLKYPPSFLHYCSPSYHLLLHRHIHHITLFFNVLFLQVLRELGNQGRGESAGMVFLSISDNSSKTGGFFCKTATGLKKKSTPSPLRTECPKSKSASSHLWIWAHSSEKRETCGDQSVVISASDIPTLLQFLQSGIIYNATLLDLIQWEWDSLPYQLFSYWSIKATSFHLPSAANNWKSAMNNFTVWVYESLKLS